MNPKPSGRRGTLNELEAYEKVSGDQIDYTYDSNGNLTQRYITKTGDDIDEDYEYDYANRLDIYKKTVGASVDEHFEYRYLPTGQRFSKTDELGSMPEERYVYDGADVVADYVDCDSTWKIASEYVQRLSVDRKVARIRYTYDEECNQTKHDPVYYLGDALGSVHYLLDSAGAIKNTQITNAWGEHLVDTQTVADRHGFSPESRVKRTQVRCRCGDTSGFHAPR